MSRPVEAQLLEQIRSDLYEMRQVVSHLDFKVHEIGNTFAGSGLKDIVASLKPLLVLLVLQGFAIIILLLAIALRWAG